MLEAWIWTLPPEANALPFADYEHRSIIGSAEIITTRWISEPQPGAVEVLLSQTNAARLESVGCLPSSARCPLLDKTLASIVRRFAIEVLQLVPVVVRTKDAEVTRYSYARPLVSLPCLDAEKSDIDDWIIPGEIIMDARLLVFTQDCLGPHHFARDSYTSHVVVSEDLKNALLATGDKGLYFCRPEDVWNIFND